MKLKPDERRKRSELLAQGLICCIACRITKPLTEFYDIKIRTTRYICKSCHSKRSIVNYHKRKNKSPIKIQRLMRLATTHRLSNEEIARVIVAKTCPICLRDFGDGAIPCIDHSHQTNLNRDIICKQCNMALGGIKDSLETAKRLVIYLERFQ